MEYQIKMVQMQKALEDKRLEEAEKHNRAELMEEEAHASSSQLSSISPTRSRVQDDRENGGALAIPDLAEPLGGASSLLVPTLPLMPPTNVAAQTTMICTPPSASMMDTIHAPEHGAQNAEIPVAIRTPRSALQNSGGSDYGPSRVRAPRSDPYAPPVVPLSSTAELI